MDKESRMAPRLRSFSSNDGRQDSYSDVVLFSGRHEAERPMNLPRIRQMPENRHLWLPMDRIFQERKNGSVFAPCISFRVARFTR